MVAEHWSPAASTLPELTSSSTSSPRSHLSPTSSLASSFSDISSTAALRPPSPPTTTKTHAFFASPFSSSSSPLPVPPKSPSQVSTRSLNADFFASPPRSAQPTPPPSIYVPTPFLGVSTTNSRPSSPNSNAQLLSAPPAKPRLPPLARFFPSRYNSDPTLSRSQREFLDLELDADATPHPHAAADVYFENVGDKGRREFEVVSPTEESTLSPTEEVHESAYGYTPLEAGTVIIGESKEDGLGSLSLIRALGRGAFSSVWLARDNSDPNSDLEGHNHDRDAFCDGLIDAKGRLVAVKVAPRNNHVATLTFEREAEVLRHISHPNITPLLGSYSTPTQQILVLPYIAGGDLLDLVNSDARHALMTEGLLRRIVGELVGAVGWLHSGMGMGGGMAVVHRDVKLENVLLTPTPFPPPSPSMDPTHPIIKLTDFGLSRIIDTSSPLLSVRCGSEAYAAPELVVGRIGSVREPSGGSGSVKSEEASSGGGGSGGWYDGRETDAWAVGVVIYALVCRALPFGEGVPVGGGEGGRIERRSEVRGREREREKERKSWLMRIAKGDYEWPSPSALAPVSLTPVSHPQPALPRHPQSHPPVYQPPLGRSEPHGTDLAQLPKVRKVVERLLIRDRKKRVRLGELLRDDEWFREVGEQSDFGFGFGMTCGEGEGGRGRFVDRSLVGDVAWREIE